MYYSQYNMFLIKVLSEDSSCKGCFYNSIDKYKVSRCKFPPEKAIKLEYKGLHKCVKCSIGKTDMYYIYKIIKLNKKIKVL